MVGCYFGHTALIVQLYGHGNKPVVVRSHERHVPYSLRVRLVNTVVEIGVQSHRRTVLRIDLHRVGTVQISHP